MVRYAYGIVDTVVVITQAPTAGDVSTGGTKILVRGKGTEHGVVVALKEGGMGRFSEVLHGGPVDAAEMARVRGVVLFEVASSSPARAQSLPEKGSSRG